MTTCFQHQVRSLGRALACVSLVAGLVAGSATAATLSGTVTNRGQGSGNYYIYVTRVNLSSPVVGTDVLPAPGNWEVSGVPNGTYFILAWQDLNGNFIPSRGEPVGFYGDPFPQRVLVQNGQNVGNLDLTLDTFSVGAELRGQITFGGSVNGRIWIVPHLTRDMTLDNTRGTPWTMTETGEYQVFVFEDEDYYVTAYIDENGNLLADPGEPIGTVGPIHVRITPGVTYANLDIHLSVHSTSALQARTWSEVKALYSR